MIPGLAADQLLSRAVSTGGISLAPINRKLDGKRHQLRPPGQVAAMKAARDLVVGEGVLVRPTVRCLVVRLPHDVGVAKQLVSVVSRALM